MPAPYSDYVIDPATGQTIRLPSTVGPFFGLPQAAPLDPDPVYPESGGDDPDYLRRVATIEQTPTDPTPVQSALDAAKFAAGWESSKRARAALPESVRNGTYDPVYDPSLPGSPLMAQLAHPRTDIARLSEATGPMGTINQIGQPTPLDTSPAAHRGFATQSDLDEYNRDQAMAVPPAAPMAYDPSRPEEAGAALMEQGLDLGERAAVANAQTDQRAAGYEQRTLERRNAELDRIRAETARQYEAQQKRLGEIEQDVSHKVSAWSNYKVDPGRRWRNASTGQKIGAALAIAMTALGDALQYKSGPNGALQIIQQAINDDVDQQIRERQNLGEIASRARSSLDDYRQEYGDWRLAREAKLAEVWTRFASDTEAQMAATRGDKARANGLALVGAARQQAAAHQQNVASAVWNREFQQQKLAIDQRQNQQQLGLAWANHRLNRDQFDWQKEYQQKSLDLDAQKLAAAGKGKQGEQVLERGVPAPPQAVVDADGNVQVQPGGVLRNADGTEFLAPTKEEAIKARAAAGAANNLVAILDEIRAIRERTGGESSWGNSDDYQRLQVLKENLVILKKAGTEGMSSDADMARIEKALGAKDPASFRAQAASLDEGRNQVVKQFNATMKRQYGYTGPDIEWTDPVKATKAAPDEQFEDLMKNPMEEASKDPKKWNALAKDLGIEEDLRKNPTGGGAAQIMANALDKRDGLAPSAQRTLDAYADVLRDPGANKTAREQASKKLASASTDSRSQGVKSYARQLLAGAATAGAKTTPETIDAPVTATASDTSYGGAASTMSQQAAVDKIIQNLQPDLLISGAYAGNKPMVDELRRRAAQPNASPTIKRAYENIAKGKK